MPGHVHLVDVLRGLRVEGEGAEQEELRLGHQRVGFVHRLFDLALLQRGVLGAEADHHALARIGDRSAGMQELRAGDHLELGKAHHVAALAAHAGFQQFIAPQRLAGGFARAGDGAVGLFRWQALVQ